MRKFRKYLFLVILLQVYISGNSQETKKDDLLKEFEKFKKQENDSFKDFKDKRDKEFANELKKEWQAFELQNGKEPIIVPKPPKQPDILPPAPIQPNINKYPLIKIPPVIKPNIDTPKKGVDTDSLYLLPNKVEIFFYRNPLVFSYDNKLLVNCMNTNESGVSDFWSKISESRYDLFLNQLIQYAKLLKLNDWGYYELIEDLGKKLFSNQNDKTLFCFFILNHLGFDSKVARNGETLILLLPFENTVYQRSFLKINDTRYYIMGKDDRGQIFTFNNSFSKSNRKLDLNIKLPLNLGSSYLYKDLFIKSANKRITIPYNTKSIEFFNSFPLTDLSVFFSSKVDPITENALIENLAPLVNNKTELAAVNILLDFVEKSFEYKTDYDQFGYEKFYFPEDIFAYPYSDCEDRAVLFSYLVKTILHLDVIGLDYKTHVASAVKFNQDIVGDYFVIKGLKYTICDPTYIGASAGMTMPQFKNVSPGIISVK